MLKPAEVDQILKLLETSDFVELRLDMKGTKLHLRRKGAEAAAEPTPAAARSTPAPQEMVKPAEPAHGVAIPAPLLGVFWHAARPGDEPFVKVGSKVKPETVIAIIEVMKLMNTVPAGIAGTVVEVSAVNGKGVEFGQTLIRVLPE